MLTTFDDDGALYVEMLGNFSEQGLNFEMNRQQ